MFFSRYINTFEMTVEVKIPLKKSNFQYFNIINRYSR